MNKSVAVPQKRLEEIKRIDEEDIEYWTARELMRVLGYKRWENFEEVVKKAMKAAGNSKQTIQNHFRGLTKMVGIGSGSEREVKDWKLDRYACYLIAQNGDSKKPEIAMAQTYFAVQTRKQELIDDNKENEKRLFIRQEVALHNKRLASTAKGAGVSRFGTFNDAGYQGLYDMTLNQIERKKKIKKGELLDRAGSTELAANLFRITQTDEKLKNESVKSEGKAIQTHFAIGRKVRQTIKDIGGVMPEYLPPERHIKEVKKDVKRVEKLTAQKLLKSK